MSRVLIAGCGDVGTALGLALGRSGHEVFGARRSAHLLPAPLHGLTVDLTDRGAIERAVPAVDIVVYAVAAGRRDEGAYRRAYVDGVSALLEALEARAEPPRRVFFVSSTSVYGERGGAWIDETAPLAPRGFAGESLVAGERRMLTSPIPATVVRFAGIYGPGRGWMIERARAGATCVGNPPKYTNRIHRDDCAGALAHLIACERIDDVYVGVDDAPVEECEVLDWLAARLGAPAPRRVRTGPPGAESGPPGAESDPSGAESGPPGAESGSSGAESDPSGAEAGPGSGAARASGKRCSNAKLRASGYRLRYPTFREGYAAVLAGAGERYP